MTLSEPASHPVFSVVVPTYRREGYIRRFLDFHLDAFKDAPFPVEIIVSDNASPDGTPALLKDYAAAHPMLRPVFRARTGNVYDNMITAYRHARGEFVAYVGDDDFLIPEKIYEYVGDLQANETIVALHAPWFMIDETRDNADMGQFYHIDEPLRFGRDDLLDAVTLVLDRHIFPEIAIFRRSHLHAIVDLNQDQAYWAFVWLLRAMQQGDIVFMPEPFARMTAVSAKGHTGNDEVMVAWDRYRGGLEVAIAPLVEQGRLAPAQIQLLRSKVDQFVAGRMFVAIDFHQAALNWIEAYLLRRRLVFMGVQNFSGPDAQSLRMLAGLQSAMREAMRLGARKVAVDPSISDALLDHLPAAERAAAVRSPADSAVDAPWERAMLALSPDFGQPHAETDLVIDLNQCLQRF